METRIVKIGQLALSWFDPSVGAQSLNFWNSIQKPTMMMERKRNLFLAANLSARKSHLHRKKIYPQACRLMLP